MPIHSGSHIYCWTTEAVLHFTLEPPIFISPVLSLQRTGVFLCPQDIRASQEGESIKDYTNNAKRIPAAAAYRPVRLCFGEPI